MISTWAIYVYVLFCILFPRLGLPMKGSYYTPKQSVACSGVSSTRVPWGNRSPRFPGPPVPGSPPQSQKSKIAFGILNCQKFALGVLSSDKCQVQKSQSPYGKKVQAIRSRKLPRGLFGCEVAPVNEAALRTFRSAIASALTFTTARRSTDLAFAVGSRGSDVGPDVEIVTRRVAALRRTLAKSDEQKEMIDEIYEGYQDKGEPGCYRGPDD